MAKTDTVDSGLPAGKPKRRKKTFKKRGEKRVVHHGVVHIQASFNNTIITITDNDGAVLSWSSAGGIGFKGSRKGTPYAATQAAISAGHGAKGFGVRSVDVRGQGARCRARIRDSRAADVGGTRGQIHPGRDPDSTQRVPSTETATRVARRGGLNKHGTLRRSGVSVVPARGNEALSQGGALLR